MKKCFLLIFGMIIFMVAGCSIEGNSSKSGNSADSSTGISSSSSVPFTGPVNLYIATNGSDENPGTVSLPLKTVQMAVNMGTASNSSLVTVYIAEGTYTPGNGLTNNYYIGYNTNGLYITNHNICISGGWDGSFTIQSGYSVLDQGTGNIQDIIYTGYVTNLRLENLCLTRSVFTNFDSSSRALNFNASKSILSNIVICSNFGGYGIYLAGKSNICKNIIIRNNTNTIGLAVFSDYNTAECSVSENSRKNGIYISGDNNSISGNVLNNTNNDKGAGIIMYGDSNTVTAFVSGNCGEYQGAGIFVNGDYNVIRGTVCSNVLSGNTGSMNNLGGAGICLYNSHFCEVSAFIFDNIDNMGGGGGGGIYLEKSSNIFVSSVISNNKSVVYGGGAFIYNDCINISFTGSFVSNRTTGSANNVSGGGLCLSGNGTTVTAEFYGNLTAGKGGAAYIDGTNNTLSGVIAGNSAGWGNAVYINNDNNKIINSIMTNNAGSNSIIHISGNNQVRAWITISNNTIGSSSGSTNTGIYAGSYINNFTLASNIFITNTMYLLFSRYGGSDVTNDSWTDINNANYLNGSAQTYAAGNSVSD